MRNQTYPGHLLVRQVASDKPTEAEMLHSFAPPLAASRQLHHNQQLAHQFEAPLQHFCAQLCLYCNHQQCKCHHNQHDHHHHHHLHHNQNQNQNHRQQQQQVAALEVCHLETPARPLDGPQSAPSSSGDRSPASGQQQQQQQQQVSSQPTAGGHQIEPTTISNNLLLGCEQQLGAFGGLEQQTAAELYQTTEWTSLSATYSTGGASQPEGRSPTQAGQFDLFKRDGCSSDEFLPAASADEHHAQLAYTAARLDSKLLTPPPQQATGAPANFDNSNPNDFNNNLDQLQFASLAPIAASSYYSRDQPELAHYEPYHGCLAGSQHNHQQAAYEGRAGGQQTIEHYSHAYSELQPASSSTGRYERESPTSSSANSAALIKPEAYGALQRTNDLYRGYEAGQFQDYYQQQQQQPFQDRYALDSADHMTGHHQNVHLQHQPQSKDCGESYALLANQVSTTTSGAEPAQQQHQQQQQQQHHHRHLTQQVSSSYTSSELSSGQDGGQQKPLSRPNGPTGKSRRGRPRKKGANSKSKLPHARSSARTAPNSELQLTNKSPKPV